MTKTTDKQQTNANRELVITHVFDAPRELVFKMWTDPNHVAQWWGPHDYTMPVCEIDLRPNGVFQHCLRSPDGIDYWCRGHYREIVESERLVFTSAVENEKGSVVMDMVSTVIFEDIDSKTKLTIRSTVTSMTEEGELYSEGWEDGWKQTFERLETHLVKS